MKHRVKLPGLQKSATTACRGWWDETSNFRRLVPQLLAAIFNNLLLLDMAMMMSFPTVIIGALLNKDNEDGLRLDKDQASWLGSLSSLFLPLGSVVSSFITEPLGWRMGMLVVNGPPLVGWLMLRFASSVPELYAANIVLGLAIGVMEAPLLCYVGEVSEPRFRSFLVAASCGMEQVGYLLLYLLGATMPWRTAVTVCATIPVLSFLAMLWVPESPLWLLARGREEEAQRALCWLRGWVRPEVVQEELRQLTAYAEHTKRTNEQERAEGLAAAQNGSPILRVLGHKLRVLGRRLRDLGRSHTRRPMLLLLVFFICQGAGLPGLRPYMVHIIEEFAMPIDPYWTTVMTAVLGLLATVLLMALTSRVGKRRLSLVSLAVCAASCAVMGAYAFSVVSGPNSQPPVPWVPFAAFTAFVFFSYIGVGPIPWMYMAEVYPLRSRGLANSVTTAFAFVLLFIATKTYLQLEAALGLHGVFWLFAAVGVAGFVFLYLQLPETEGKTLEEVEEYFASKGKKGKGGNAEAAATGDSVVFSTPGSPLSYDHVTHM